MLTRKTTIAFVLLFSGLCLRAQVVVDKVAAVVGDRIILQSDINNAVADRVRNGDSSISATCLLMEQAIVSKLLMIQAERDSLPVSEEYLEEELNRILAAYNGYNAEPERIEQIKKDVRDNFRERNLANAMKEKITATVRITPAEVRAYFNAFSIDELPLYETSFEIGQIVRYPDPSQDINKYILGELNNFKIQLETHKTDFCTLAKISDDPATAGNCGEYHLNRNNKNFDAVFLSKALRLKEGEISKPVKTKYGYHLLQLISKDGDNIVVRHFLRIPPVTEETIKNAATLLDSVRAEVYKGSMDFKKAAFKYNNDEAGRFSGYLLTGKNGTSSITLDELDKETAMLVSKMNPGEISKPVAFTSEDGRNAVRIIYLKSRTEAHRANLRDDYEKIAGQALAAKKNKIMEVWLLSHIPAYHIEVNSDTKENCPYLDKYLNTSVKRN